MVTSFDAYGVKAALAHMFRHCDAVAEPRHGGRRARPAAHAANVARRTNDRRKFPWNCATLEPAIRPRVWWSSREAPMPGKRVQIDDETWQALDLLARDRMQDFQELADEALRDLLRKYGRPTDLKSALRQSAGQSATIHKLPSKKKRRKPPAAD
jgi:hypothetical protein